MKKLLLDFSRFNHLNEEFEFYFYDLLDKMIFYGSKGPCAKSKRVSAIITNYNEYVISVNTPPVGFNCQNNDACKKVCNQVCVHAEENAILTAFNANLEVKNSTCLHLKIKDGNPTFSGRPSCIYCSRKLLQSEVKYMYLFHENGWKRYTSEEFHRETLKTLGIFQ